jgi:uncharacterized membrane protein YeiH
MITLLSVLDFCGTFVFAISGAAAGVRRKLDLFGVLVLSFAAATAGGIARDLMIGDVPPVAARDWRYGAVTLLAGVVVFFADGLVEHLKHPVLIFDAAGLALFAVSGAEKALTFGLHPAPAAVLGMLTGIGGGMARDILLAEVPTVLRAELYAVAALGGATIVVLGYEIQIPSAIAAFLGALLCFSLRLIAVRRGWHLPVAGDHGHHAHHPADAPLSVSPPTPAAGGDHDPTRTA